MRLGALKRVWVVLQASISVSKHWSNWYFSFYKNITMFWIRTMKSWYQGMPWDVLVRGPLMGMVQDWRLSGTEEIFIQNISHYWTITLFFLFWPAGWTTSIQHIMYLIIIRMSIRVIGVSIWRWIVWRILGLTISWCLTPLTSFWWWWIQSTLVSSILFMPKYGVLYTHRTFDEKYYLLWSISAKTTSGRFW